MNDPLNDSNGRVHFSLLSSNVDRAGLEEFCRQAQKKGDDFVIVNPYYVSIAKVCLEGSLTKVCVIVDYPSGQSSPQDKAFSASDGLKHGAVAVALIPNLRAVQTKNNELLKNELTIVKEAIGEEAFLHVLIPIDVPDEEKEIVRGFVSTFPNSFVSFPDPNLFPDCQKTLDVLHELKKVDNLPSNEEITIGDGKHMKKHHRFWSIVGSVFWVIIIGWWLSIYYLLVGVLCCITIIFIPIGIQWFKFSALALQPFGKDIEFTKSGGKIFLNVLWIIFGGWENSLFFYILGAILCVTIVFIPFGLQFFKFGKLAIMPLGARIVKADVAN